MLFKVLGHYIECFAAAVTKKRYFLHKNKHVWFELYKSC